MSTPLTVRADLAAAIRAEIDASSIEFKPVVYDFPVELPALPAVVLVPSDPYWQPRRFGAPVSGLKAGIEIQLIVPRTEVEAGIDLLEALAAVVISSLSEVPVCRWVELGQPEPIEVNKIAATLARVVVQATF
jgi:hypothetical protein